MTRRTTLEPLTAILGSPFFFALAKYQEASERTWGEALMLSLSKVEGFWSVLPFMRSAV